MAATLNVERLLMAEDAAEKDECARDVAKMLERSEQVTCSLTVEPSAPVLYERGLAAALCWPAEDMAKQ